MVEFVNGYPQYGKVFSPVEKPLTLEEEKYDQLT
jgi:hypothetical protein